jgi:hypothetical protein
MKKKLSSGEKVFTVITSILIWIFTAIAFGALIFAIWQAFQPTL